MRGSSRREDVLDNVLKLARVDDAEEGAAFSVTFSKARNLSGHAVETFRAALKIENGVATWKVAGLRKEQDDLIRELHAAGRKSGEIADEVGLDRSTVSRRLAKMRAAGRV